jgi:restriction endonuclease S subunit
MYKQLKDIADVKLGYSLREKIVSSIDGNVCLLTPKDILHSKDLNSNIKTKINLLNPKKHFINDKEILLTSRGNFSAIVFNASSSNNFIASSGFHRINVIAGDILPEYIALFLNSKKGQKALKSKQETTTVPAITIEQLKDISIPLISLKKQKQLIDLINSFSCWNTLRQKQEKLQFILINQIITKIIGERND